VARVTVRERLFDAPIRSRPEQIVVDSVVAKLNPSTSP
jgi:hypothetical protein